MLGRKNCHLRKGMKFGKSNIQKTKIIKSTSREELTKLEKAEGLNELSDLYLRQINGNSK